jgi:hypothetical protein
VDEAPDCQLYVIELAPVPLVATAFNPTGEHVLPTGDMETVGLAFTACLIPAVPGLGVAQEYNPASGITDTVMVSFAAGVYA